MTSTTLLFRQVNPSWVQQGRITSQTFNPTPKDKEELSVYDGDQITAETSWEHYTSRLGFQSVGVVAVMVDECTNHGLQAKPDPTPFPEHVLIDFTGLSGNQKEKKAKSLRVIAQNRGWQYQVETAS